MATNKEVKEVKDDMIFAESMEDAPEKTEDGKDILYIADKDYDNFWELVSFIKKVDGDVELLENYLFLTLGKDYDPSKEDSHKKITKNEYKKRELLKFNMLFEQLTERIGKAIDADRELSVKVTDDEIVGVVHNILCQGKTEVHTLLQNKLAGILDEIKPSFSTSTLKRYYLFKEDENKGTFVQIHFRDNHKKTISHWSLLVEKVLKTF